MKFKKLIYSGGGGGGQYKLQGGLQNHKEVNEPRPVYFETESMNGSWISMWSAVHHDHFAIFFSTQ